MDYVGMLKEYTIMQNMKTPIFHTEVNNNLYSCTIEFNGFDYFTEEVYKTARESENKTAQYIFYKIIDVKTIKKSSSSVSMSASVSSMISSRSSRSSRSSATEINVVDSARSLVASHSKRQSKHKTSPKKYIIFDASTVNFPDDMNSDIIHLFTSTPKKYDNITYVNIHAISSPVLFPLRAMIEITKILEYDKYSDIFIVSDNLESDNMRQVLEDYNVSIIRSDNIIECWSILH